MFCGTEFDNIDNQKPSNTLFTKDTLFLIIKILVVIIICVIGFLNEIDIQVLVYATIFIELFIHYLQFFVFKEKGHKLHIESKNSKKVDSHKSRVRRMIIVTTLLFFSMTLVMGYLNTIKLPETRKKERYEFEIEPGYEYVSYISALEMTSRMNKAISSVTDSYENLKVVENYYQFYVTVDIQTTDNFRDAEETFRKLIDVLYTSDKYYSYLTEFQVNFYHNDQYVHRANIMNMFLINEVSLNNDATFYDVKSNTIVFFKTLDNQNFTFIDKKYDENNLDFASESYIKSFKKWYQDFDRILFKTYDAFDIVELRFMNRGIKPEMTELVNLGFKINDLKNHCDELNQLKPDFYHEVYYQYSQKGCQYYVKAFEISLDGLRNYSVERIEYSYSSNNIGYSYLYKIYE